MVNVSSAPPDVATGWSEAPPALTNADQDPDVSSDYDDDDVDVTAGEVVEVDIDIDEPVAAPPAAGVPAESGRHLVAEPHAAGGVVEIEMGGVAEVDAEILEGEAAADRESAASAAPEAPGANEVVEPAPSSSPRPIVSEKPSAYEEESAPRHTPPPESGKQVSAPSVRPEPRKTTPPIEGDFRTGASAAPPVEAPRTPSALPQSAIESRRPPDSLRGEFALPSLPASANVAAFTGAPPSFKPVSFGDLLDASLAL